VTSAGEGEVAALYESYPYPAHGIISSVLARMAGGVVAEMRSRRHGQRLAGLDAGCGTGEQTLGLARAYPDLEMTGVDFSDASLAFARDLSLKHGVPAGFARADLTRPLEGLGPFDLVVCVGTLHHLPDPRAGLRALRGVIREGGVLLGMVYGTFGKQDLFRARDALRLLAGEGASREERLSLLPAAKLALNAGPLHYLRALGYRARFGPDIAVREALLRVVRGRSSSYQADAFTHPQETSFTWSELDRELASTGFRLTGWPRRSGMPDDPRQLFGGEAARRLSRMTCLAQAAVYERVLCPPHLYFLAEPA
jgi:SAM-dependent methyltransferase